MNDGLTSWIATSVRSESAEPMVIKVGLAVNTLSSNVFTAASSEGPAIRITGTMPSLDGTTSDRPETSFAGPVWGGLGA